MDNQQQVPNRQNSNKSTHWFAYMLATIGLAVMIGILIKLIISSFEIKFDDSQLKVIASRLSLICQEICILRGGLISPNNVPVCKCD